MFQPLFNFFFQAEAGIRDVAVTGVQTCALPILIDTGSLGGRTLFNEFANRDRRSRLQMATDELDARQAESDASYEANVAKMNAEREARGSSSGTKVRVGGEMVDADRKSVV